ncbi:R-SNARE 1 [Giardia muris]|uniref:R-SNARE 1 n=1 Tax=Giardia muris TaxID=5742 RepID=A0A4Z1TDP2_GIAMU|nr:R-SNARE 1 [Giardia muris]|eukprot:TNJ30669.1 R-SNARE 1 [Giardia muris]
MNYFIAGRVSDSVILLSTPLKRKGVGEATLEQLLRTLSASSAQRSSYASGDEVVHYLIDGDIAYIVSTANEMAVTAAMAFLQNVSSAFSARYSKNMISSASCRSDVFADFVQELDRLAQSAETRSALSRLHAETSDIKQQMLQSLDMIINRGQKLNDIEAQSADLSARARAIMGDAKALEKEAFWRQNSVYIIAAAVAFLFLLIRFAF